MKKNYLIAFFCCLMCIAYSVQGQQGSQYLKSSIQPDPERCGTMDALENRIANDPAYAQFYEDAYNIPKVDPNQQKIPCDGTNSIVVPVAFHFSNNAATGNCAAEQCILTEVMDQLDAMNAAFQDNTAASTTLVAACPAAYEDGAGESVVSTGTCISFCLAIPPTGNAEGLDPNCDPPITIGAFNGGFGAGGNGAPGWGGILNIFITNGNCLGVADGIPGAGNGDGVSVCSEAFGGVDPSAGCGLDDNAIYGLGATLIHEVGHYLGLFHTFQGSCNDEPNGPGPFDVDDTPPAAGPYFGCNTASCETSGCGGGVQGIANFMDYTDDACMTMFTEDQAQVMNYWSNQLFGASASQCSNPTPTELTTLCQNSACIVACPTAVTVAADETFDYCGASTDFVFPDPTTLVTMDDNSDVSFSWSTGGYLSAGGVAIAAPTVLTAVDCTVETETYYINADCITTPLPATLDAGTVVVNAYPVAPADISTLVVVGGEGTCAEPTITPIAGCESYITVVGDAANPTFPVNTGDLGTASYTVTFTPDPAGPDCCDPGIDAIIIDATTNDGDLEGIGAGAASPWTSTSTNFGSVMCNNGGCGTGGGSVNYGVAPNSGTYLGWFGGIGALETGTLEGSFIIPTCGAGTTTLTFAYENSTCGDVADFIELQVDGNVEWSDDADPATCGALGTPMTITVDLSAYADGANHTILFTSTSGNAGVPSNFTVDNISLLNVGCSSGVTCDVVVTGDYDCSGTVCPDLTYEVSASPICSGDTVIITKTGACDFTGTGSPIDSGPGTGTYPAFSINISSNPVPNPIDFSDLTIGGFIANNSQSLFAIGDPCGDFLDIPTNTTCDPLYYHVTVFVLDTDAPGTPAGELGLMSDGCASETFTVEVYPIPPAPSLDIVGSCQYLLTNACPNDTITIVGGNGTGTSGLTATYDILPHSVAPDDTLFIDVNNGNCTSEFFFVPTEPTGPVLTCPDTLVCGTDGTLSADLAPFAIDFGTLQFDFILDAFPSENFIDVIGASGAVVATFGPLSGAQGSAVTVTVDIPLSECPVSVNFLDTFGDGLQDSCFGDTDGIDGSFTVTDLASGAVLLGQTFPVGDGTCGMGVLTTESYTLTGCATYAYTLLATGVWSGPGVTDNGDGTAVFSQSGGGTYTATYTYTSDIGCEFVETCEIVVDNSYTNVGCVCVDRACESNSLYVVDPAADCTEDLPAVLAAPSDWIYEWYLDGVLVATVVGQPYYSPSTIGNYTVVVYDPINCESWDTVCNTGFVVDEIIDCTDCDND